MDRFIEVYLFKIGSNGFRSPPLYMNNMFASTVKEKVSEWEFVCMCDGMLPEHLKHYGDRCVNTGKFFFACVSEKTGMRLEEGK